MTIAKLKRLDIDKYDTSKLYGMVLSQKEPQVIIAKGNESAIILHWKDEYQPLLESHPRPLGSELSNIKEECELGIMAIQILLSGEQDMFILLDKKGKKKLAIVGIERYGKFIGEDFPKLSEQQSEKIIALCSQFNFENSSEKNISKHQMQTLGFAIIQVKLIKWGGEVNGFELWQETVYNALKTLNEDLKPKDIQTLNNSCHDFKLNWQLYEDKDPLAVALKYHIKNNYDIKSEDKIDTLTIELRPQVEEFIDKIDKILL